MVFPKRKRNRLIGFDYGQNGGYFITLCVQDKKHILSSINVGEGFPLPQLTVYGEITDKYIRQINEKYPAIQIDKYVVMPNHIHILLSVDKGSFGTGDPSPTVEKVMGWFKYQTTKEINLLRETPGVKVWQRSFHDHIIRGQQDYEEIYR